MSRYSDIEVPFAGLSTGPTKFISPNTRVGLRIYPNITGAEPFIPSRSAGPRLINWDRNETEASIQAFSWNKTIGAPSGQWTVEIKPIEGLLDFGAMAIVDGDWVDISILRNGVRLPVCRGVVDSVRRSAVSKQGALVEVYTLSGRDHGAFTEYPITWSSLWARTLSELASGLFTRRIDGRVGGSPDELFRALIDGAFQGGTSDVGTPAGQWTIPEALASEVGSKRLIDLLQVVTFAAERGGDHLRGAYYNEPALWAVGEQTLHQTLGQWTNQLMNEFWFDLLPSGPSRPVHDLDAFLQGDQTKLFTSPLLTDSAPRAKPGQAYGSIDDFAIAAIIRERPFPTVSSGQDSMWFSLPTWTIPAWMLQSFDLGRSGDQRFNVYELLVDFGLGSSQEQAAFARPRWSKAGIASHGLRAFPGGTTKFTAIKGGGPADWLKERKLWLEILVDWFASSPYLLQGSIQLAVALPEIRVGHRIFIGADDSSKMFQAYVEGVNISVEAPTQRSGSRGATTLHVTRGFIGTDQDLLASVKALSSEFEQVF